MINTHHNVVNLNVNYELQVIMMYQYQFLICKKGATSVGDVGNEGGRACVGSKIIWKVSILSAQFCFENKTAPKINSFKKLYYFPTLKYALRIWLFCNTGYIIIGFIEI